MQSIFHFISIAVGVLLFSSAFAQTNGQSVTLNGFAFQVANNAIYYNEIGNSQITKLNDSDGMIDSLSVFDGKLFALEGSQRGLLMGLLKGRGTIFVFKNNTWIPIGYSATQILASDDKLVALTREGELWIFKNEISEPKVKINTVTTVNPSSGKVSVGVVDSSEYPVSFYNSGVKDVLKISEMKDDLKITDILIQYKNGTKEPLSMALGRIPLGN